MTRSSPPQTAFSSGELSPLLHARTDYQRYQSGLAECRGFVPMIEGGITRAPGTIHRGSVLDDKPARLIRFEFARDDAVTLEFTNFRMRVWRYGTLVTKDGAPYELETPYPFTAVSRMQFSQSADVIYMVDNFRPMQKLSRFALDDWSISPANIRNGPFRVQNLDEGRTIQSDGETGSVTLTSNFDFFTDDRVDSLLRLEAVDYSDIPLWSGNTEIAVGDDMRYGKNIYRLVSGEDGPDGDGVIRTGVNPPIHTEGDHLVDATEKIVWRYISDGIGIVRITGRTDARSATAQVRRRLAPSASGKPTYRWSEGAWSERYGYPGAIEIVDQRLAAAATSTDPRTVWFSTVGAFEDFEPSNDADGSFAYSIAGQDSVNRIQWLKRGTKGLHIGALGEEYSARSTDAAQALGPTTVAFKYDSNIGSAAAQPITPNGFPLFISRDGRRLFEVQYSFERDANSVRELSRPSQHLGVSPFEQIVWQSAPQRQAWLRRQDGVLVLMIYDPTEEVLGWALCPVAGGHVESLSVGSDATGSIDVLTMVVRREFVDRSVRFVEEQALTYGVLTDTQTIADAVHLFAARRFTSNDPVDTFDVPHLAGAEVICWSDKGEFGPYIVGEDGRVVIETPVNRLTIGLFDASHRVTTLPIQAPARDGDARGRPRRLLPNLGLQVHRTAAGHVQTVEREVGRPDRVSPRQDIIPLPVAADLGAARSGTLNVPAAAGYAEEVALRFTPRGGAPMTILASVPTVEEAGV